MRDGKGSNVKLIFLYLMQVVLTIRRNRILRKYLTKDMNIIGDFGCGHFANKYANVLVDQFCSFDEQRGGLKLKKQISGRTCHDVNLNEFPYPFADKEFDFLICSHVLEHLDDPVHACVEFSRIAKAGYIEVPYGSVDVLIRKNEIIHKWLCSYDKVEKVLYFLDRKRSLDLLQPFSMNIVMRFLIQLQSVAVTWNDRIEGKYLTIRREEEQ